MQNNKKSAAVDLTQGRPLPLIITFMLPLLLGQLFQQVYSITDTTLAGHILGDDALAAIGATTSFYDMMLGIVIGLSNGFGVVLGRLFGAGDEKRMRQATSVMIAVGLGAGLLLGSICFVFVRPIMAALQTPAAIFEEAHSYLSVMLGGLVISVIYNVCAGFMRALGNSRVPLMFLTIACGANILLDVLFMYVLHLGVGGAAAATVLAQGLSAIGSVWYIRRHFSAFLPGRTDWHPDRKLLGGMIATGLSMALMGSVVQAGSVIMTGAINGLGETVITSVIGSRRIFILFSSVMMNLGVAAAAFTSQNYGAGRIDRVRQGVYTVLAAVAVWSLFSGLILLLFGGHMIRAILGTENEEIVRMGHQCLIADGVMFVPLGLLISIRQCMQTLDMRILPVISSSIELGMKVISALFLVPVYGFSAVCWAEPATWLACGLFVSVFFFVRMRKLH